jgi:hypothetical protein
MGCIGAEVGTVDLNSSDVAKELFTSEHDFPSPLPSHGHQVTTPPTNPQLQQHICQTQETIHTQTPLQIFPNCNPLVPSLLRKSLKSSHLSTPSSAKPFSKTAKPKLPTGHRAPHSNPKFLLAAIEKELDRKVLVRSLINDTIPVFVELRDVVGEEMVGMLMVELRKVWQCQVGQ